MKKQLFVLLFFAYFVGYTQCPGVQITTQSQIDNFASNYPGCTEFEFINIDGIQSNITNLDGFSQIENIIGDFSVQYTGIMDFSGLENLVSIGLQLNVSDNESLINFNGLSNLEVIGAGFNSSYNIMLENYIGFNSLTHISSGFHSNSNYSLQSFQGLEGLIEVEGTIIIFENNMAENLHGLDNLATIGGAFGIYENQNLQDLVGLESLQTLGNQLVIEGNTNLQTLNGLENLQTMIASSTFPFFIFENPILFSIDALNNLDFNTIERMVIHDNPNLSTCAINSICEAFGNSFTEFFIENNQVGCNSVPEVEAQCQLTITEEDFSENLSVFPNPVSSILNIETSKTISFEKATVYSLLGKLILETSEKQINLETLSAGIYFVEVVTDKGSVTKKIVKE